MTETAPDTLERSLEDLVKRAERLLDRPYQKGWYEMAVQAEEEDLELFEGIDFVTLLIHLPGYAMVDLKISAAEEEVQVLAKDFTVRRSLPCRVDPVSVESSYRNGILSIKMLKR